MANRPEDQPTGDYARETASGKGFVGITKDDPLWQNASRSMDFIAECYDKDTGGFNQLPVAIWCSLQRHGNYCCEKCL